MGRRFGANRQDTTESSQASCQTTVINPASPHALLRAAQLETKPLWTALLTQPPMARFKPGVPESGRTILSQRPVR
jgi:hypothetical protein